MAGNAPNLKVIKNAWGCCTLENGTQILFRVAVTDARPAPNSKESPFGVEFELGIATGVASYSTDEVREKVRDKPTVNPNEKPVTSGFKQMKITGERQNATEELEYHDSDVGRYSIKVELEPTMATVNMNVRTAVGEPMALLRWIPKAEWSKLDG